MISLHESPLSTEHLLIAAVTFGVALVSAYFLLCKHNLKLPPIAKESKFETLSIFVGCKDAPNYLVAKMKELGDVFRIPMPVTALIRPNIDGFSSSVKSICLANAASQIIT